MKQELLADTKSLYINNIKIKLRINNENKK